MNPDFSSVLSFPVSEIGHLRFVDTNPGSDLEPVVLLHGMLGDIGNWKGTLLALDAAGYRAIAPVLPVYSIDAKQANLDGLVRYIRSFLLDLQIDRCIVVGNSLGGHLAVLLAARFPELVTALVLTGASGIYEVDLGTSIMRRQDRDYLRKRAEKTFHDPKFCTEQLLDDVISIVNTREYVLRLIRIARSVQRGSVQKYLSDIDIPTLLIWGKEDRITPLEVAKTFRSAIPKSVLRVIDDCGHAPMMEQPEAFSFHLLSFLETTSARSVQAIAS